MPNFIPERSFSSIVKTLATAMLLSIFTLLPSPFVRAQCTPDTLLQTIPNPAAGASDFFGSSVAVSGSLTVVGSYLDNAGAADAGTAYVFNTTTGALVATLSNPAPAADDEFGYSVAISGNVAVVGARLDDAGASNAGTAYVFNATTGALTATLFNPSPTASDQFGYSVAISGSTVVVGALQDDAGATDAGRAYVFNATTGAFTATLSNPDPTVNDFFGGSVAISGNLAVVGAYQDDAGTTDAGTAYVFNASTGALVATLNNPAPAAGDNFGISVAISGNVAVVGAYQDDAGASDAGRAYVFNASTGALTATLSNPSPTASDLFGWSVAISGNVAVVGAYQDDTGATDAGTAYVFNATTGALTATLSNPAPAASDVFGWSVAISVSVVVVGARLDDAGATNAGSAYTFTCASLFPSPSPTASPTATRTPSPTATRTPSPTATQTPSPTASPTPTPFVCSPDTLLQSIPNPAPAAGDFFGVSVAADGNLVVVGAGWDDAGATDAGTAYVFNATTGALVATLTNPFPTVSDLFGYSVAISGNVAVVGAYSDDAGATGAGRAYVFNATTGALTATLNNPSPTLNDLFGYSVAVSGNLAVVGAIWDDVGATDAGTAYVFNATNGGLVATLTNPSPTLLDNFGTSVAISGNVAVVGASQDDAGATDAGRAYVFNATTGALTAILTNPSPTASDYFGVSVAISGNVAVVGAFQDDAGASDAGTAYVFNATSGAPMATLTNPSPTLQDYFGISVSISGNLAVVGAYQDDAGATDSGTAYVFNATTGALTATLSNPSPASSESFGGSVAISGSMAVVGAYLDDAGASDAGSAYTFTCASLIPSPSPTASPTATRTPSPTATRTPSPTASPTASPTPSPSASPTASPTLSPSPTISATPTPSPTASPSPTGATPTPSVSPTSSPSPTASPTLSPTASPTDSPTATPTATPTASPTASPSASPTLSATPTLSPTASGTESPTPTDSPTAGPTDSPTATPGDSPSPSPAPNAASGWSLYE